MTETTLTNRQLVTDGFAELANGNLDAVRKLLHEDFIEHSPGKPSGRDAAVRYLRDSGIGESRLELKRVIADDDVVALHYHVIPPGDDRGVATAAIFRVENGLVVEHWDVTQPVPPAGETPNGMF
jgi:predicted SnoaL-like aldol condensation-catalyzing enzyme